MALYKASVQEKYKFKYMLSLEAFAHGVISSIIIYLAEIGKHNKVSLKNS